MVEASEIGLKEEEIELDLGLSIGGSFRKSEKPREPDSKSNGFELHLKEHEHHQHQAWPGTRDAKRESLPFIDSQKMRDIHALRRQTAKKKREEKQQKRVAGMCRARTGDCVRESGPEHQRVSKREKTDHHDGGSECPNVNLNLSSSSEQGVSRTTVGSTASFPHPYAYVPLNNGFAYSCVVPWLAPCGKEKNVGQPAGACKGFRPFSANGCGSEPNGERDCGDKKAKSNGSSMCSSVVSDHPSSSHEGGGSCDSHSHSAHSLTEPTQLNRTQPEQSASSHPMKSENVAERTNPTVKEVQPEPNPTKLKEEPTKESKAVPRDNNIKPMANNENSTKTDMGKPPKPLPHTSSSPLRQMPYVSTTGTGPEGKTINGFLYRYTNSEVSIVCVCHGSTFSPAEFVQHAGGTDVSQPLKHITVIPSAFG